MGGTVRWGVLATGGMAAAFTTDLMRMPDAEVVAVASRTAASAEAFAGRFGIPRAYGSWDALAADEDVDVVYVATPHAAHRAAAGLCLEAGKAVLCEKPFTMNAREAEELVALARERGLFLMEAMWMYCGPVIRRLTELVAGGAVGEVRSVHADFGLVGPADPGHRLRDPAVGGGALLDLGVYPVSFAHLLLGEPDRVSAHALLSPEGVDLNTGMLLGWDSGATALLSCSIVADTPLTASVSGTEGRIEFSHGFYRPEGFTLHRRGREPEGFTVAGRRDSLQHEAAEVMRCLRAGETESPLVPLDGTLAVMRTLDAVRDRVGVRYPADAEGAVTRA
ncbi:Gfo/Idh/MocA family oxidoreductase [Streptomyces sp. WAC05374]|uniref:Gfo/Idh/MocA family protein n=1 Tax=Streptomyces sp. WAC05374 TaxID=2487420 RepID=UPI000F8683D4|nr:Gfo/Idh/MocA family oxidoreductase [Streptomyces sp. WAC05374]RST19308.1 gfo/Idh/MocA family oxidoreductase [Streptomyces sp. WAC05374]TDF47698.1 Gfo/Idh/MocA family oxidoreductase [Streptomyces sp. WAC05374]TDF48706.1 Gfo/Idh/MocA family oxidoreductase [Streptomyces sp. WAC05374]TDF59044.1 Gfo/Idh/MocA family oxidoreductase [Streptomyces sp. WAC05374]